MVKGKRYYNSVSEEVGYFRSVKSKLVWLAVGGRNMLGYDLFGKRKVNR